MTFLIAEGVTPSNEGRGYILRRLIRRAVVQARAYRARPRLSAARASSSSRSAPWYPEVAENAAEIERVVRAEEERFRETLERGMKVFEELAGAARSRGEDAFTLAATYGFPIELTVELAEERGQPVDVDGYRGEMERHREISRGTGEKGLGQRAAEFAARRGLRRPSSSATRRRRCSRSSARSRTSATARSWRSSASRPSIRPAAAR